MQHDRTSAHSARIFRLKMQEIFPQKWIRRGGIVHWPARSPDLTPRLLSLKVGLWQLLQRQNKI